MTENILWTLTVYEAYRDTDGLKRWTAIFTRLFDTFAQAEQYEAKIVAHPRYGNKNHYLLVASRHQLNDESIPCT